MEESEHSLVIVAIAAILAIVAIVYLAMTHSNQEYLVSSTPTGEMSRYITPINHWPCIDECMRSGQAGGTNDVVGLYKWCRDDCWANPY